MKKIITLLVLFTATSAFAQKHSSVTFNFTDPEGLNPPVTMGDISSLYITDREFTEEPIRINFSTTSTGARITNYSTTSTPRYALTINSATTMNIIADNEATIDSIRFDTGEGHFGDLGLLSGQPGYQDPMQQYKFWKPYDTDDPVTSVSFYNNGYSSQIDTIYVYFSSPSDVLVPESADIYSGKEYYPFSEANLTFATAMTLKDASGITVVNVADVNDSHTMNVTVSGTNVRLYLNTPLTTEGDYKLTIPAGRFKNSNDYENKELTYEFTVKRPANSFAYESVFPSEGTMTALPDTLTLKFPSTIGRTGSASPTLTKGGYASGTATISLSDKSDDEAWIILNTSNPYAPGNYTITVPEQAVYDESGAYYNPAFTLEYVIEESATMQKAKELLARSGVGYPSDNSTARLALKALTDNPAETTDEDLTAAIDDYCSETDITLPATGNYYHIAGVNSEGKTFYLAYADGSVCLSEDADAAAAFKATANADSTTTLRTTDGKYLHVFSASSDYDKTSTTNVTDNYDAAVNNLSLAKLSVEGVDGENLLGCMSIYGSLGTSILTNEEDAIYALIYYPNVRFVNNTDNATLYFNATTSSAFVMEETEMPMDDLQVVQTAYTISPDIVEDNTEKLTLTFTNATDVQTVEGKTAYFTDKNSTNVQAVVFTPTGTAGNTFEISLSGLADGDYTIAIPEGAFIYDIDGVTVKTQAIAKDFEIGLGGSGADGGFSYTFTRMYYNISTTEVHSDVDLNDFYIYITKGYYTDMIADPNMTVRIARQKNDSTMCTGHFESYTIPGMEENPALKLVLDKEIKSGDLKADSYSYVIKAGTFGDANFGKYLEDKRSVDPADCRVNSFMTLTVKVDNSATAIREIESDANDGKTVIYDLAGRRIKAITTPGIYIINGKKVVKNRTDIR